jgi:5,10-methylenetetrahydromethanopterin reductase
MAGPRTLSEHDRPALRGAVGDREVEVVTALPMCVADDPAAARAQATRGRCF